MACQARVVDDSQDIYVFIPDFGRLFPNHMRPVEIKGIKDKLTKLGFYLESGVRAHLIHDGSYDTGNILNFRKRRRSEYAQNQTI